MGLTSKEDGVIMSPDSLGSWEKKKFEDQLDRLGIAETRKGHFFLSWKYFNINTPNMTSKSLEKV